MPLFKPRGLLGPDDASTWKGISGAPSSEDVMAGGWTVVQQGEGARSHPQRKEAQHPPARNLLRCSLAWRGRGSPLPAAAGEAPKSPLSGSRTLPPAQHAVPCPHLPTAPLCRKLRPPHLAWTPAAEAPAPAWRPAQTPPGRNSAPSGHWQPLKGTCPAQSRRQESTTSSWPPSHQGRPAAFQRATCEARCLPFSQPPSLNLLWEREDLSFPASARRAPSNQVSRGKTHAGENWKAFPPIPDLGTQALQRRSPRSADSSWDPLPWAKPPQFCFPHLKKGVREGCPACPPLITPASPASLARLLLCLEQQLSLLVPAPPPIRGGPHTQ